MATFIWGHFERHKAGAEAQAPGQLDEVPAGVDLAGQDLGLLAVGQLEQMVGQRDALAAGPLVDEEAGLGGLPAAADVEGVDDVGEAEPDRGLGELRGLQFAAVAGPAGVQELALGRRALPVLDLQVLAEAGRVRNR
jgi:hypothetical protein